MSASDCRSSASEWHSSRHLPYSSVGALISGNVLKIQWYLLLYRKGLWATLLTRTKMSTCDTSIYLAFFKSLYFNSLVLLMHVYFILYLTLPLFLKMNMKHQLLVIFHTYLFQLFPFYFLLIVAFKFSKKIYFIPFVFIYQLLWVMF